ncbi:hypothetical protein [Chitinophaga vietnamensis]|uniref:hypothetical protein n=1 Tax=Chitinophaga vietnamensis TaxID=2593957 RepID=UPI001178CC95|nr:hypothetical protein [Chitinophaga vietnamensis]
MQQCCKQLFFATFGSVYKKWLHKIFAVILLGVFSFNTVPREFIHSFAGHHDTEDDWQQVDGTAISGHHRHCDFLQIGVEPYEPIATEYIVPVQKVVWVFMTPPIQATAHVLHRDLSPRAPPALFV